MDSKELEEKALKKKESLANHLVKGYKYARSLGFNSYEATVLQGKSKENIESIARERGYIE
jgi:hypothetical protein